MEENHPIFFWKVSGLHGNSCWSPRQAELNKGLLTFGKFLQIFATRLSYITDTLEVLEVAKTAIGRVDTLNSPSIAFMEESVRWTSSLVLTEPRWVRKGTSDLFSEEKGLSWAQVKTSDGSWRVRRVNFYFLSTRDFVSIIYAESTTWIKHIVASFLDFIVL